jgi:hypothetical protein
MIEKIAWLTLAHYIADYPLQGDFLARTKGENFYSLLAHSTIYGLTIGLTFKIIGADYYLMKALLVFCWHMVIDCIKARAKNKEKALTTYLYIDQACHLLLNYGLLLT